MGSDVEVSMFRNEIQPELFPELRNRVGEQYDNLGAQNRALTCGGW